MIDFKDIVARVAALKEEFPSMDPREIIRARGISLLELPMGTSPNAIKGFIQKNNRCCTIVVNADLLIVPVQPDKTVKGIIKKMRLNL